MSGFEVNGTHTLRDMGLCCASRSLSPPVRKSATKSLPYADGLLDFSQLDGRPYFEARTLAFAFDLVADSPQELEAAACELRELAAFVHDADIRDDDCPSYHWHGSVSSIEEEQDEYGLSSTVTVSFAVDPYRIADFDSEAALAAGTNHVLNAGAWARPTIEPSGSVTVQIGNVKQSFSAPLQADFALERGWNEVKVAGGSAVMRWRERRL